MSEYSDYLDDSECDYCFERWTDCICEEEILNEKPWSVEVKYNGESLVTIESSCYGGKSELTKEEREAIRNAAFNLLAFVGNEESEQELSADGIPF